MSPHCAPSFNEIQVIVSKYEKLTSGKKAYILNTNHDFAKQFFPGRPEHRLVNEVKNTQSRKLSRGSIVPTP